LRAQREMRIHRAALRIYRTIHMVRRAAMNAAISRCGAQCQDSILWIG